MWAISFRSLRIGLRCRHIRPIRPDPGGRGPFSFGAPNECRCGIMGFTGIGLPCKFPQVNWPKSPIGTGAASTAATLRVARCLSIPPARFRRFNS